MQSNHIQITNLFIAFFLAIPFTYAAETKDSVTRTSINMRVNPILENNVRHVQFVLTKYVNGKTRPVDDLETPVKLYLNEVKDYNPNSGTGLLGEVFINWEGEGIIHFPATFQKATSNLHEFTFIAKLEADPIYVDIEKEVAVSDAKVIIEYHGEDSIKSATAILMMWKDTGYVPVPEGEIKLGIKRTINYFPIVGEGASTDEAGKISGELPMDLPGNLDGTLTLIALLDGHEEFGTIVVTSSIPWNILPLKNPERGRTLWSPGDNAPIILVVTSVVTIIIIWGTILYLLFLLVRLKKLGNTT